MGVEMAKMFLVFRNIKTICYVNNFSATVETSWWEERLSGMAVPEMKQTGPPNRAKLVLEEVWKLEEMPNRDLQAATRPEFANKA